MSLVTQCPSCATTFKVVRDQLKISDGWVRCGQCSEVFDSTPNLRDVDLDPTPPPLTPQEDALPVVAASTHHDFGVAEDFHEDVTDAERPVLSSAHEPQDFSFIAKSQPVSAWQSRTARVLMALVSLMLVLSLLAQVMHGERDRLAAMDVRWRSALFRACEHLGCEIRPWQQIESIAVESSGFHKLRFDTYRLSFVVSNSADVPLAKPALELTLTDSQDLPLLRRVLLPTELDAGLTTVGAHGEWTGNYVVSIAAPSTTLAKSIAGYRLLAFYP